MVQLAFNAREHNPQYGGVGGNVPPGRYKGVIIDSRKEDTAKGGGMLVFDVSVIEGPQKDQIQTDRLNLLHSNPKTVKIANDQLAAYCAVTGVYQFNDTSELHNKPFQFEVAFQKGHEPTQEKPEGGYTEIRALADMNGNPPNKAGQQAPASHQPPPAPAETQPANNGGGWGAPAQATQQVQQPQPEAPKPSGGGWGGNQGGGGGWDKK